MELLLSASLIAAFIAGMAALFAPCCITVLLPAYFASIFRERYKVFLMTFIFFLGILTVFLPIGLGAAALGRIFSQYHNTVFGIGGAFLILMGLVLLSGKHFSLPFRVNPSLKKHNAFSVFILGIFSGIATTCCAPVLAGVLALSVLPGSVYLGLLYTLAYVLGMVAPLFLIAACLDKFDFTKRFMTFRKSLGYSFFGQKIRLTYSSLMAGVMFTIIGILTLLSAKSSAMSSSDYQLKINLFVAGLTRSVNTATKQVPEVIWGILLLIILGRLIAKAVGSWRNLSPAEEERNE